ncbi:hypothetical protein EDI_197990 [Entamoeba dispar SAW760]|uniref:Uncharacterized protein n=1 Tax=Entamoeba dispar (strain ATCC PRA-260 / SAW760) TaxID=370354 RepID=B0EPG5_ENTDS|nr:uncharacterized protein EDI_197990 [Entamoeba dispar SAW760]EDR23573.1 hypothetical protein EDI_197990 [Entamoeba dispar SAW760]|eukprot:EDR23573.1 hypothetical protein EDI_197990 [Entamoeba dispar SAW760]
MTDKQMELYYHTLQEESQNRIEFIQKEYNRIKNELNLKDQEIQILKEENEKLKEESEKCHKPKVCDLKLTEEELKYFKECIIKVGLSYDDIKDLEIPSACNSEKLKILLEMINDINKN